MISWALPAVIPKHRAKSKPGEQIGVIQTLLFPPWKISWIQGRVPGRSWSRWLWPGRSWQNILSEKGFRAEHLMVEYRQLLTIGLHGRAWLWEIMWLMRWPSVEEGQAGAWRTWSVWPLESASRAGSPRLVSQQINGKKMICKSEPWADHKRGRPPQREVEVVRGRWEDERVFTQFKLWVSSTGALEEDQGGMQVRSSKWSEIWRLCRQIVVALKRCQDQRKRFKSKQEDSWVGDVA